MAISRVTGKHFSRVRSRVILGFLASVFFTHAQAGELDRTVALDIPSQPLSAALIAFSEQADIQLAVQTESVDSMRVEGVTGEFISGDALRRLLLNTGLTFKLVDANTVAIFKEGEGTSRGKLMPASQQHPIARAGMSEQNQRRSDYAGNTLEEITVTARKREESLQDTPISITAFSGDDLELRGITRIDRIQDFAPNVVFQNYTNQGGATNNASMYIRGIGQNDFVPTVEPGVGLYIDGIYFGRTLGSTLDLIDIERIEVLRGPQGTLFGRNTIGGAISVTTKKPDHEFAAKARMVVGTDDKMNLQGAVNIPFSDTLFASLSVASLTQDGYVKRTFDGKDLGDKETLSGRAALRWLPTDNLELNLTVDYARDRDSGAPNTLVGASFDPGSFAFLNNVLPFLPCGATPPNPAGSSNNPACFNSQYFLNGQDANAGTAPIFSDNDVWGVAATVTWQANDWLELKSISALREVDSHFGHDLDASPVNLGATQDKLKQKQLSQELQLLGTAFEEQLHWVAGFYFFQEEGANVNTIDFITVGARSGGDFDNDSVALYAQGTYDLTEKLSLTLGLRYTEDSKEFLPDQYVTNPGLTPFSVGTRLLPHVKVETEAEEVTPMLNLSYYLTDALLTYVTYSEGFKGGGFHQRVFPPLQETPSFDPEFVNSYEVGFKYNSPDKTLRLNGSAFYTDYEDIQVTVFNAIAPVTDNAGGASIMGFELEAQWVPAPTWLVSGSAGYLDAEYDKVRPDTGLSGDERLPRVSDWTLSAGLSKEFFLGAYGTLKPRLDWSYRSRFSFDTFNLPFVEQEGYHLVNASAYWESSDGRYGLVLAVDNLFDKEYLQTGNYQPSFGWATNLYSRGREWHLTARFNY